SHGLMKNTYDVVPAERQHIAPIAANARPADVAEIAAASGRSCFEALLLGLRLSDAPMTGLINGVPACMFGIVTTSRAYNIGAPWMIGSTLIEQHAGAFLRRSKSAFYPLAARYTELDNYV